MSRDLISIDVLNGQLEARLDSLVSRLFPQAQLVAGIWRVGSIHGEAGQSLGLWTKGVKRGQWFDFSAPEHGGDLVQLVHLTVGRENWKETFDWIRDFCGLGRAISPEEMRRQEAAAEETKRRRAQEDRDQRARLTRSAQRHYLTGVAIPGTPVERYLLGRNIHLSRLGKAPGALRYHSQMLCPETKEHRPCMLASMQRIDEPFVTVHRTFLLCHADGRVTKADKPNGGDMADAKVAYSAYSGAWIPIWRGESGRPMRQMPEGEWIAVTEGIEDALTLALAAPRQRVIAALSLSNIGSLQLPERAGGIILCADNDVKEAAKASFLRARAKLEDRGYRTIVFRPPEMFKDFNEWAEALMRRAA